MEEQMTLTSMSLITYNFHGKCSLYGQESFQSFTFW